MKFLNTSYKFCCLILFSGLSLNGQFGPRVTNPLPDIGPGTLAIELEEWVTIPASSGGIPRAKLSVFRTTPDGRFWVNDQRGKLWQIIDGEPEEYFDIKAEKSKFIDAPGLGTGFHSFAFHPDFLSNGKFYTTHTESADAEVPDFSGKATNAKGQQGVITEWTVDNPMATSFSGTSRELMRIQFPGNIHCLQEINFRPTALPGDEDYGLLYICVGDGGSYNGGFPDNTHRLDSPFGAILRIDPEGNDSANSQYGIPQTNPWAGDADSETLGEIYAYGFRNPHRLTWDRGGDGLALIGGIGEQTIEEVNILISGGDYGWPVREGTWAIDPNDLANRDAIYELPPNDPEFGYTYPVAQYDHDDGFAIVGGYVYRGSAIPELSGMYVFGDIKNGRVFYLDASELVFGQQAPIYTMVLTQFGQETTLPTLVGRDRADLRFGEGHDRELYIMTKTDGVIRRVVQSEGPSGILDPNPEDFVMIADFEDGEGAVSTQDGTVKRVNDPYSGSLNTVLAIDPENSAHVAALMDGIPSGGTGTLYFRFAIEEDTTLSSFGFSDGAAPTSEFSLNGLFRIGEGGSLSGRDRLSFKASEVVLRAGQWYEAWLVVQSGKFNYELHLRGGGITAPALVSGPLSTFVLNPRAVNSFAILPRAESTGRLYLDDLFLDDRDINFSSPLDPGSWRLVSNLEGSEPLTDWILWGAPGTPSGGLEYAPDFNGNTTGKVSFGDSGNGTTLTTELPLEIDVSGNATLFARLLPAFSLEGERFGITSTTSGQALADDIDSNLEASVRFLTMPGSGERRIVVRDADGEVPAMMPDGSMLIVPEDHGWIDVWLVVRNGGQASGGQTYDVYLRADFIGPEAVMIAENATFRQAQELPLVVAAIHGTAEVLLFDDVFLALGQTTDRPLNLGDELFPNPPGPKEIPWFGWIDDSSQPWILHETHGWIYVNGSGDSSAAWAMDPFLGWIYLDSGTYPVLYSEGHASWMYYYSGTSGPRWFYSYISGDWISE